MENSISSYIGELIKLGLQQEQKDTLKQSPLSLVSPTQELAKTRETTL